MFRQLLDPTSSTYSYLPAGERTGKAVLIDSVREQFERDRALIEELQLELETHVHADHVTGSRRLREHFGGLRRIGWSATATTFSSAHSACC